MAEVGNLLKLKNLVSELKEKYRITKSENEKLQLTLKLQEESVLKARKILEEEQKRQRIKEKLIEKIDELEILLRSGTDI